LWIYAALSRHKLFETAKHAIVLVFAVSILLRMIPELVAYPYPIGYDVVNYYIPVVANFDAHWPTVISQFPLYVLILHFANLATGLSAHATVTATATVIFGIFGVSLFYAARSLLNLGIRQSVFLAFFAVFQMAVLRTAWDLHRDVFALTAMLLVFSFIEKRDARWKIVAIALALAALVVAGDRMMGALFCISLVVWAAISRRKIVTISAVFSTCLFSIMLVASYTPSAIASAAGVEMFAEKPSASYNPQNLLILFAIVNGLLAVPATIGFLHAKSGLVLKIPLIISLAGSFSWLAFPTLIQLVADRWIVIAGIFLSIFAGYGILHLVRNLKPCHAVAAAGSTLVVFAAIGLAYATMPYGNPFMFYGLARTNIENFVPVTMQFNSLDIHDSGKMLSVIAWINENTEQDAVIVGEKHWRGFMEVYLQDHRTYRFAEDPQALARVLGAQGMHTYLLKFDESPPAVIRY
jgi:hypothetical protein